MSCQHPDIQIMFWRVWLKCVHDFYGQYIKTYLPIYLVFYFWFLNAFYAKWHERDGAHSCAFLFWFFAFYEILTTKLFCCSTSCCILLFVFFQLLCFVFLPIFLRLIFSPLLFCISFKKHFFVVVLLKCLSTGCCSFWLPVPAFFYKCIYHFMKFL